MATKIQWTEETWNPVVGCTRASRGCDHCYAVRQTHRLEAMGQERYAGLTVLNARGDRHFNGVVRTVPEALAKPLGWKKPRRIFVNSMSDLFHPAVPFEFIDRVFAVMALTPRHTYQILTKRPERMAEYFGCAGARRCIYVYNAAAEMIDGDFEQMPGDMAHTRSSGGSWWPLPNVWLGTSCEDQAAADERIPHLLRCPAAVRFLSCEPLLGRVDLGDWISDPMLASSPDQRVPDHIMPDLHWVIVGGESGADARPCDVAWVRSIVEQCRAAAVPCFVKQLGALPIVDNDAGESVVRCRKCGHTDDVQGFDVLGADPGNVFCNRCGAEIPCEYNLHDRKGGDPGEWPNDLRVREMPAT